MTGRDVLNRALLLMDRVDCDGMVDTENTADYENKALVLLNPLISELSKAERREEAVPVSSLEEEIALTDDTVEKCLSYGLASHLAFMDNDMNNFNFYQTWYERNKALIPTLEEGVVDTFNALGGMQ
ncbi:hypothetical protein [Acetivibrio sp. MSJd-27]|jgi:hypothetical protein|uniref:hypothetical protein n=1 Tax=Acetivibrio sp. MSJd-27 TaxID=2841523 RepID=UPI0015B008EB|nr:hypothetical protein [Acetivibrio sp. MSJd-27]MBU5449178.1 hypothetical protein [Acetivibrio sp. MSJd-27]